MSGFLLFTMIFNGGMIPTFLVLRAIGLTNTLAVVILLPAISVYNLVLMRNFFEGIPESLFEAAEIDGASPIDVPQLHLEVVQGRFLNVQTVVGIIVPVAHRVEQADGCQGSLIALLPFMILYPFLQKYFVKGVNIGAVKE